MAHNEQCKVKSCFGFCIRLHLPGSKKKQHVCCINKSHTWEA